MVAVVAVIAWDENVADQRDDCGQEAASHIRGELKGICCRDVMAGSQSLMLVRLRLTICARMLNPCVIKGR